MRDALLGLWSAGELAEGSDSHLSHLDVVFLKPHKFKNMGIFPLFLCLIRSQRVLKSGQSIGHVIPRCRRETAFRILRAHYVDRTLKIFPFC